MRIFRPLRKAWAMWLKFAVALGNIQMVVLLSLVYWTMLAGLALPLKLLSDPLGLRHRSYKGWVRRQRPTDFKDFMSRQG